MPAAQLHEVRRFTAGWERQASVRLRDGDLAAVAAYDRHGRIWGADEEAAAAAESVVANVMGRDAEDLSATEQIRQAQEWAGGTGHLLHLW